MRHRAHWLLLLVTGCAVAAGCGSPDTVGGGGVVDVAPVVPIPLPPGVPRAHPLPSVVLIVAPGIPHELVRRGMAEGWLPNLRRLAERATVRPLAPVEPRLAAAALLGDDGSTDPASRIVNQPAGARIADATGFPATLPVVETTVTAPLLDALARDGRRVAITRWPVGFPFAARAGLRALGGGALPDASFNAADFVFVTEDDAHTGSGPIGAGRVVRVAPTTGGARGDLFRVEVPGLPVAVGQATTTIEVLASPDRTRATVTSSESHIDLVAGVWSQPLLVRYAFDGSAVMFARLRCYLRPTGVRRMELLIEAPDFDPTHPPPWLELSTPPEWVRDLKVTVGQLPRFEERAAVDLLQHRLITERGVAARIETQFKESRRLLEVLLAEDEFELLMHWFEIGEDCARLAALPDPQFAEVELFGRRVPCRVALEEAAHRLDEVLGGAMASAAVRGDRETSVLFVSPCADGQVGVWAATRASAGDGSVGPADLAATVLSLLHTDAGGLRGRAIRLGPGIGPQDQAETRELLDPP